MGSGVIDCCSSGSPAISTPAGLLSGEVGFIATTLVVIDVTLAALFWSWGAMTTSSRASSRRRCSWVSSPT